LSLHLFEDRDPAFDIGEIELKSIDNPPDIPQVLKDDIVRLVSHNANLIRLLTKSTRANHTASAPEMISISSLVIIACRVRL
jgi:hypothetical protein